MKESELEKLCLTYVNTYCTLACWKVKAGGQRHTFGGKEFFKKSSMPGFPDIMLLYNGKFIGVELKVAKGRQSLVQKECQLKIENAGGLYYICRSFEEFKFIIESIL